MSEIERLKGIKNKELQKLKNIFWQRKSFKKKRPQLIENIDDNLNFSNNENKYFLQHLGSLRKLDYTKNIH